MLWPWKRARSAPVITLGKRDAISMQDIYSSVLICGAPGSGKTKCGLGQLAKGLLTHRDQPSLVVAPAKGEDVQQWRHWHRQSGSRMRFFVFGEETCQAFNWLEYACRGPGGVAAAVPMLSAMQQLVTRNQPMGGDAFFLPQGVMMLSEAVRACWLGNGKVCVRDVHQFLATAPSSDEELGKPGFAADTLRRLNDVPGPEAEHCLDYWAVEWVSTCRSEKTAAAILATAMQPIRHMLTGPVGACMSGPDTTFAPHDLEDGYLLVLNFPVLQGFEPFRLALAVWMMAVNRYALTRPGGRPMVTVADEYAQFAQKEEDARIAATGRSHRIGGIRIIQNLPQLATAFGGGDSGRQEAMALAACMGHTILFANGCVETARHYSELFGQEPQFLFGGSMDTGGEPFDPAGWLMGTWQPKTHVNYSQSLQPVLPMQTFLTLETPVPGRLSAEAIVIAANRTFADGKAWKRVSFDMVR